MSAATPTTEELKALHAFDQATAKIHSAVPGNSGASIEARYGQAYEALVRLGLKPRLRAKYRLR